MRKQIDMQLTEIRINSKSAGPLGVEAPLSLEE